MTALDKIKPYAKAVVGFAVPALTAWVAAQQDGSVGGSTVTTMEWGSVAIAALVTGGAVFFTPNRDPQAAHQDESVQPPDADVAANRELARRSYSGDSKADATYHDGR